MTAAPPSWIALCRAEGFEPVEVRTVMGRYQAYRRYYEGGRRGPALPILEWFHWYHRETASEVQQNAPSPDSCSVDPQAEYRGAIRRPEAFVKVLLALEAAEAAAGAGPAS